MSHASMAMGGVLIDNNGCELFNGNRLSMLARALATISAVSAGKSMGISAEHLSKVWNIPHDEAVRTLGVTTQQLRTNPDSSLSCNVGTNDQAVFYRYLNFCFFMDTLFVTGKAKSTRDNICAQLFMPDKGFVTLYPMKHQRQYPMALKQFVKELESRVYLFVTLIHLRSSVE
jgi:hypothetical protein